MGSQVFSPWCKSKAPLAFSFHSTAHPCKTPSWAGSRPRGLTNCQNQPLLGAGRAGSSLEKLKKAKFSIAGLTGSWSGRQAQEDTNQEELPHLNCVPRLQPPAPDAVAGLSSSVPYFLPAPIPSTAPGGHFSICFQVLVQLIVIPLP